jgi:hypothetical protein
MPQETHRGTLLDQLLEANKRAGSNLGAARALGAKLFGAQPEAAVDSMPEMSANSLLARLNQTLAEIEEELHRQHDALGSLNAPPAMNQLNQQRAVGY